MKEKSMIKPPPIRTKTKITPVTVTPKNDIQEVIEYYSHIDNYSKEEFQQGVADHKWYLETLLNIGSHEEVREFMSDYAKITYSFLVEKAIEQLKSNLKLKLDNICAVLDYLTIEHEYQLDNTFRLFNNEAAIAIGDYENYLILASEKHCHVIDIKKIPLQTIHSLFTNGKVNIFYKAAETLQVIKNQKILMTNNIFDVTTAYKLLLGDAITAEELDKKINEQIGNYSDKDKAIRRTQLLLKVRLELRQQIIEKKLINEAKEAFKSLAEQFTVSQDILTQANTLKKMFDGVIIQPFS